MTCLTGPQEVHTGLRAGGEGRGLFMNSAAPKVIRLSRRVLGRGMVQLAMGGPFVCKVCGAVARTTDGNPPFSWPAADRCDRCGEAA